MKILVLSTCYPKPTCPSHGIFIHRQTKALAELGIECHVLQPVDWAPPPPLDRLHVGWRTGRQQRRDTYSEVDGIPVHHPRIYHPIPSRFFPGDYWERVGRGVAAYVARRPRLRSASLLYSHFLCHEGYAGLIAAKALGMPHVAIARGDDVHAWPERWPDRIPKLAAVLKGSDGLLACSRGLARDAARWASDGLSRPIDVVYNGVDTVRFRPVSTEAERREARSKLGLPEDRNLLLSIATPIAAKGWLELLDALAMVQADTWHLVMVGTARNRDDLDLVREAHGRGLGDRVLWLGNLGPDLMPDLYRAANAFVLASRNEGLSNSMVEAMATGIPVVVTNVGGHAELVENDVTGWLVPPESPAELAAALREAMDDAIKATRLGAAARDRAVGLGDHRTNAKALASYFERLLARPCAEVREPKEAGATPVR